MSFITENAPLLVSLLALLGTVSANVIADGSRRAALRAETRSEEMANALKQSEILLEIETQRGRLNSFLVITCQKMLLLQKYPPLLDVYPNEYERLDTNLKALQKLKAGYELQRSLAERAGKGGSAIGKQIALTEIKRLTIALNEDMAIEENHLAEIQRATEALQAG